MKRAVELDPLSLIMNNLLGFIFRGARQSDRAIQQGRMTVEMDPGFAGAHLTLGLAYEQKGMDEQAIAELEMAVALSGSEPWHLANLGHMYAAWGRRDDAQKILDELKQLSVSGRRHVSPCLITTVLAGLGNNDQAFDWLEKSYQERGNCLGGLKVNSMMDNLRSDARFTDLVRRMNFPD
jgi:tetratricopeptide (TPR) repeat protein